MGKITKALEKARSEAERMGGPSAPAEDRRNEAAQAGRGGSTGGLHVSPGGAGATAPGSFREDDAIGGGAQVFQGPVSPRLVVFHEADSLAAEHFKVLRSQILHPKDGQERRVILVTSAVEQEGKTFVACNLALSIAMGVDPYALLIDADIRRPAVHGMLGIESARGLSEYLQGEKSVSEYLIKTPITKLTVLPAGRRVRNPSEILTSARMGSLLREVRERYPDRFVIIDSPPVNLAAETLILAQNADAVVFVVRYGHSHRDLVEEAVRKVGREKILGMVFNGFEIPPRKYSSYYGKRYSYSR